jgi:SAM-dependent methyltransferase
MTGYVLALSEGEVARYRMMAARARVDEETLWRAAGIVPGARVADVGCGPGALLLEMAALVGPAGSVVGIDADPAAVATARGLVEAAGATNARVAVGAADATGLEPGSSDVVVMRHVLAHNGGREDAIVAHLATLVRPGGRVFVLDIDGTAMRMRPGDPDILDLDDRYRALHLGRGNDLQIGLRLGELLRGAGLETVDHRGFYSVFELPVGVRPPAWAARDALVAEGLAAPADVDRWDAAFRRADAAADRPVLFAPFFTAIGQRPR